MQFVRNSEKVIFVGLPRGGKVAPCHGAKYESGEEWIRRVLYDLGRSPTSLKKKAETDRLSEALQQYPRYRVLIMDEIGCLPMDKVGAHLLFQLVNNRYEKATTIFTSNKAYSEWGDVMGDSAIAAAALDRTESTYKLCVRVSYVREGGAGGGRPFPHALATSDSM